MDDKMKAFLSLMYEAFSLARQAHDCSFRNEDANLVEDKCSALSFAAACTAKYSAAEAIYWCTEELSHGELPELFTQFDTFTNEIRSDYKTNHSRQWVDIEFNRLKEMYDESVCNQRIS